MDDFHWANAHNMKKVLVVGINGLIGREVFTYLAQSGVYDLVGTVRHLDAWHYPLDKVIYAKLDLTSGDDLYVIQKRFGSFDVLINCAAALSDSYKELVSTNCLGLLNCISLAKALGITRFIHFSSIQVIGSPHFLPITEEHQANPQSLYHVSKLFGEHVLLLKENFCLNPVILRLSSPVGPGFFNTTRIIPTFLRHALRNENIILYGNGLRKQNYTDTRDIAKAVVCAIESDKIGIYNVSAMQSISNIGVADLCKKVCGSNSKIVFNGKDDPEESFNWEISIIKITKDMGFVPDFSLEDSLRYVLSVNDSAFNV